MGRNFVQICLLTLVRAREPRFFHVLGVGGAAGDMPEDDGIDAATVNGREGDRLVYDA
jgi:hypothetical protein